MPKLHELQERRASVVSEMRALNEAAEKAKRDYTADEDKKHKDLKTELTGLDRSIERARDLADAERAMPAVLHEGRLGDGRFEERARSFSLLKAINARLGDAVDAGFEREISTEVARRSGRKPQGILVPDEYFLVERRVLTVQAGSPSGAAASLYPEQHRADLFIDLLRNALITGRLGATILDNLVGDQDIPRQTGSSTAQWLDEEEALTETDASFDDVTLSPKTVGAVTSYSRRTLINAVPSIEDIIRRDLAAVIANAIDDKAVFGSGAGEPLGIVGQTGVNSLSLSTPTWAQVLAMISNIQSDNAEIGSLAWAMAPEAVAKLRSTVKVSSTDSVMLMETADSCAGYPVAVSNMMRTGSGNSPDKGAVVFGAWSQLLIGYWSATDILVNPYDSTSYLRGRVMVRAMRDVDVAVRHGESFAKATDLPV